MDVKRSWKYAKIAAVEIFAAAAIFFLLEAAGTVKAAGETEASAAWNEDVAETVKAAERTQDAAVWKEDATGMSEDIAAQKIEESIDSYMQELDFSDIDKMLSQQAGTEGLDFKELVQRLLDGEEIDKGWLAEEIFSAVFSTSSIVIFIVSILLLLNLPNFLPVK